MSIFGINDSSSSAYSSILSKSKENKENNQVKFANAMIKDNVTKLSGIQTQNSFTLAKNEILNSNPLDNPLQNSIYALKYKQGEINKQSETNQAVSMAYGYGVDSQGYMTSDFNKAAGLPEDFKIHKSTLEEIERYSEDNQHNKELKEYLGISKLYTNIDMADTIRQYYSKFNQIINHSFNDTNKTSFSEADLESLPKGYSISYPNFDFVNYSLDDQTITNYYNQEQLKEAKELELLAHIDMDIERTDFTPQSMQNQNLPADIARDTFNPDMSVYSKNEKGEYPKEALFMSFLKSRNNIVRGITLTGGNTQLNPIALAYKKAMAKESFDGSLAHLDDIMTGKVDFINLFKHYIATDDGQYNATFGFLYAYENGMSKDSMLGNKALDSQIKNAIANGWRPSSESVDSYISSAMDRLNNLINQTRA